MLEEDFYIIFSCVKAPFFDESWINRRLDRPAIGEMKSIINRGLTQDQLKNGIKPLDLCGERGEYHTMCIDGPLYSKKVILRINNRPIKETSHRTKWKGNIHNSTCTWTMSLANISDDGKIDGKYQKSQDN